MHYDPACPEVQLSTKESFIHLHAHVHYICMAHAIRSVQCPLSSLLNFMVVGHWQSGGESPLRLIRGAPHATEGSRRGKQNPIRMKNPAGRESLIQCTLARINTLSKLAARTKHSRLAK